MTSLTTAIKTASGQVSPLLQCGGQWSVQTFCTIQNGWVESHQTTYAQAQAMRNQSLIDKTLVNLGMTLEAADHYSQQYDGGSWVDFARKHAKKMRQEAAFKARYQPIN